MIRVLSTKKLLPNQRQFLLNAGFSVVEADFIAIENTFFELEHTNENLIFTSQNAVKSVLENEKSARLKNKNCFCVGAKTKHILEANGFNVAHFFNYASELAAFIVNEYASERFTFFSGNLRQDDLPETLQSNDVAFNEIQVYETTLVPNKINAVLDAILFFSPSGVASYLSQNKIENETCFCIGTTTEKALQHTTNKTILAKQPTVENVIIQTLNHYKKA